MPLIMNPSFSSRDATFARAQSAPSTDLSLPAALGDQLSTLYALAQGSQYVFGSPLGPFRYEGRDYHLPRFVYFGPHTSDVSVRLAFLAGLDRRDLRTTLALLQLVGALARNPTIGQSLHLAFYPLVDVLGHHSQAEDRGLSSAEWSSATAPEIVLLAQDARQRAYHGYVRVESAPADDVITLRLRGPRLNARGAELVTSEDTEPFAVRWETWPESDSSSGPLALGGDLQFLPFELTLCVPGNWPVEKYRNAVATILQRVIVRYRSFLAYGQHL